MANTPSVLFINRAYPPVRGATGRILSDLAHAFVRDGWSVTILTTGPDAALQQDGPIRVVRMKSRMKGKGVFGYALVLAKSLFWGAKLPRHELVVSLTDPPLLVLVGYLVARIKSSRHIHWCQDLYPDLFPVVGLPLPDFIMNILTRLSTAALRRCDRIVVIGRCMARVMVQRGIDAKKIAVIPNWPDSELITVPPEPGAPHRKPALDGEVHARPFEELFRDGDHPKFRVLYSGTLGRAHPIKSILDAAEILARNNPEIEFVFVGDGPGQEKLAHERAKRGLENIRFLPWQPPSRLREVMESGDVHMISIKHDAAGLLVPSKLYSAFAAARPCIFIGPMQSEAARVINDFKAGVVIAQGEPETLARAILSYCQNSETWYAAHAGSGQAGRIFVPAEATAAWIKRARDTIGITSRVEK